VRYLTFFSFYEFFCSGGAKEIALAISSLDVMIKIGVSDEGAKFDIKRPF
jgi:hypothetical protein